MVSHHEECLSSSTKLVLTIPQVTLADATLANITAANTTVANTTVTLNYSRPVSVPTAAASVGNLSSTLLDGDLGTEIKAGGGGGGGGGGSRGGGGLSLIHI